MINQEDQEMLSEEEEEEDSQSEDHNNVMNQRLEAERAEQIGQHLTGESRNLINIQSPLQCLDQDPSEQEQDSGPPKIFSGSSDEWTDARIREFQEHIEFNRRGGSKPIEESDKKQ